MKKILALLLAVVGLSACTSQQKQENAEAANEGENAQQKILVLYYSQTGATKTVAEEIASRLGADMEAIEATEPYDGDFSQTIARCNEEMEAGTVPAINPLKVKPEEYDLIFLGYPVWFGTYAQPIAGLIKDQTFEGKKIVTFCTFGSGGLQTSTTNLKEALPKAEITEGYGVRNARIAAVAEEVNRFLIENGYMDGEIEALPAFMEHKPVTDEEVEIFNQACSDYQYPLGTPVDVAVRETTNSTDYEYTAVSPDMNGGETRATIYVTLAKKEGSKPEFTQVIR